MNKLKRTLKSESGQSVILVAMVILSFLMFFGFAINTGVLVTAKISVQSAADAAAYAGAATQARQMNAISFLNYDMRQQYKKFLYRYAFLGNMASPSFPNHASAPASGPYTYPKNYADANNTFTYANIKVPVVCIPLTGSAQASDQCLQLSIPNTLKIVNNNFPGGGLSSITKAFIEAAGKIQSLQELTCAKTSGVNLYVLLNWLIRDNVDQSRLDAELAKMAVDFKLAPQDQAATFRTVSNLIHGLGLYPRNIINNMRITTLTSFLNQPKAKPDLKIDDVLAMEKAPNADAHERTIQAFKSALVNLNNEVLDHQSVIMQELQNDKQIEIANVEATFDAFVQFMKAQAAGSATSSTAATICNSSIIPFRANAVPVGVKRTSTTPVHYAVKVTAKAKLLFLPGGAIELEAFASAKPFGSRIGPADLSDKDFISMITPGKFGNNEVLCSDSVAGQGQKPCPVPNLYIEGTKVSFYSTDFLKALASDAKDMVQENGAMTFKFVGEKFATSPQPAEVGHYNIIPPPPPKGQGVEKMKYEFIPYAIDENSRTYRFYAPVFPSGVSNVRGEVGKTLDKLFPPAQLTADNPFGLDFTRYKQNLEAGLPNYVESDLQDPKMSERGETITFAAVELPAKIDVNHKPPYWLSTVDAVNSSWTPTYVRQDGNGTLTNPQARFGYSVKFVAMQNLLHSGSLAPDDDQEKVSH